MAITVQQVGGCYVFSCPPKVLLKPVYPKHQRMGRQKKAGTESSFSQLENVLYAKAVGKSQSSQSRTPHYGGSYYEDSECPPVDGRSHMTVQTDLYLEELCDVVEEVDVDCQTDPLLDRPPSPLFVPTKIGVDAETQIYPGELFDFDREVQPLLEVLVGQTLEQSLIEIMEEEELAVLTDMQHEFEARRNAEIAEQQRLAEQERRLYEERQRRLKEQEEAVKLEEEMAQKIAACVYAQNYLSDLMPQVYKRLEEHGYIDTQDPVTQEVEENFWPWLMNEVDGELTALEASYSLLDSLIEDAVETVEEEGVIKPVTPDKYPPREEIGPPPPQIVDENEVPARLDNQEDIDNENEEE